MAAYYQWRLWNAVDWARYKGVVIVEKATGKSVSSRRRRRRRRKRR